MSLTDPCRAALRKEYRARRNKFTQVEQQQAASALLNRCLDFPPFLKVTSIACYLSNDGEVDTQNIIEYCWQHNISVLLPLISPQNPGYLLFLEHRPQWPLKHNKYGIAEPQFDTQKVVELVDIDIIFTPLVAFDKTGNRLGMGGGYYDRTLANLMVQRSRPLVIGLAHDCQITEKLPVQSWDIPLNGIITPSQIFTL
jgi:5-formyltetrahydrofolate cyclo-ligase